MMQCCVVGKQTCILMMTITPIFFLFQRPNRPSENNILTTVIDHLMEKKQENSFIYTTDINFNYNFVYRTTDENSLAQLTAQSLWSQGARSTDEETEVSYQTSSKATTSSATNSTAFVLWGTRQTKEQYNAK